MTVNTDPKKIDEILTRGVTEVIHTEELRKKLLSGEKLRIKLGIDPTSSNLHLGRSIPLLKLRDFQELGHQVIFLIGDFTGVIGDTSDKDSERPMISHSQLKQNMKTYFAQTKKILNMWRVKKVHNSKWLKKLGYAEIGEHANMFSVADFIARDNIKRRLDEGKRVSLREILYPLMQGYDSVALKSDVELGGNDQRFNLLAGRTLQEKFGQEPQSIVMTELIEGLDGRKMSSSWGNTINLTDEPHDMFGKVMSMKDELVKKYFILCTRVPLSDVETIMSGHPKEAKMRLAKEIVTLYHGSDAGASAEKNFTETFSNNKAPENIVEVTVSPDTLLVDTLIEHGIVSSKSDFRRLVGGGAITNIDTNEKITDEKTVSRSGTYKVGKHRFIKIQN